MRISALPKEYPGRGGHQPVVAVWALILNVVVWWAFLGLVAVWAVRRGRRVVVIADRSRGVLPIPERRHVGVTTYDAKDPDTSFPPIVPLRPPAGAPNVLVILAARRPDSATAPERAVRPETRIIELVAELRLVALARLPDRGAPEHLRLSA